MPEESRIPMGEKSPTGHPEVSRYARVFFFAILVALIVALPLGLIKDGGHKDWRTETLSSSGAFPYPNYRGQSAPTITGLPSQAPSAGAQAAELTAQSQNLVASYGQDLYAHYLRSGAYAGFSPTLFPSTTCSLSPSISVSSDGLKGVVLGEDCGNHRDFYCIDSYMLERSQSVITIKRADVSLILEAQNCSRTGVSPSF